MHSRGCAFPEIYGYDDSRDLIDRAYILMECVKEDSLRDLWSELSESERKDYLKEAGNVLAECHLVTFPNFGQDYTHGNFGGPRTFSAFLQD